jgi:hypothetical protein
MIDLIEATKHELEVVRVEKGHAHRQRTQRLAAIAWDLVGYGAFSLFIIADSRLSSAHDDKSLETDLTVANYLVGGIRVAGSTWLSCL